MSPDAVNRVAAVLRSGYIGQGEQVENFETVLSDFIGKPSPLTLNSATSGLTLALRLICESSSEPGEILAPPITCTATNCPILANGQSIRWVDTSPVDGNMDIEDLRRKVSPNTKAIMLVHWGGYPNDLDEIEAVVDECYKKFGSRPAVIEDAAHALGASFRGKMIGTSGNYCVFSFQAIKHLTCGDGGALICPTEFETERARRLRWYGMDRSGGDSFRCEQDVDTWGYKFHMNDISASIGLANIKLLPETLAAHRQNSEFYRASLIDVPGIRLLHQDADRVSASWLFTLRAERRDDLKKKLDDRGIGSSPVHRRNDTYTCTRQFVRDELPGTDIMDREMLCIPVGWWVSSAQRQFIVETIREGW